MMWSGICLCCFLRLVRHETMTGYMYSRVWELVCARTAISWGREDPRIGDLSDATWSVDEHMCTLPHLCMSRRMAIMACRL